MKIAFIQGIGPLELTIVLVIVLLFVGPKRLPGLGRSIGSGMRELRASLASKADAEDAKPEDEREGAQARPALAHPAEPVAAEPRPESVSERS